MTQGHHILILTAGAGGGHKAAGEALSGELASAGHHVLVEDGLNLMSGWIERLAVSSYRKGLTRGSTGRLPTSWGMAFKVTSNRHGSRMIHRLTSSPAFTKELRALLRSSAPDLVVSTYPLVSAAVGRLRRSGELPCPVAALITDYGAHPLWVASGVDLNLVPSRISAGLVERAGGKALAVRIPTRASHARVDRRRAREDLGVPQEGASVALISGGAWGAGNLGETTRTVLGCGWHAIVATGGNEALMRRLRDLLEGEERVLILGWRKDMAQVMAASDCLIQNAGGMTALEAIDLGVPLVSFDPIAGHGEYNARIMEEAGVALWARDTRALEEILTAGHPPAPQREEGLPSAVEALENLLARSR
ncbi:MGDG synthase family glycosyltransferase [Rubrobacter naiadicus]|uniref:MGDG synthase family glycosyltransferase n=1 Tax=Rubrobacter naiadicus TaxID=1392641 RepID=UPI00235E66C5|nr:glycosyltransferase [Rubrobacter naiadicus]